MRFIVMHKVDAKMEASERPSKELIQSMGQLVGRTPTLDDVKEFSDEYGTLLCDSEIDIRVVVSPSV